jgi:hypothetical protein
LLLTTGELRRPVIDGDRPRPTWSSRSRRSATESLILMRANQRRHQHVLEHGALRQQAVILEHEADLRVAELGDGGRRSAKGSDPAEHHASR